MSLLYVLHVENVTGGGGKLSVSKWKEQRCIQCINFSNVCVESKISPMEAKFPHF